MDLDLWAWQGTDDLLSRARTERLVQRRESGVERSVAEDFGRGYPPGMSRHAFRGAISYG